MTSESGSWAGLLVGETQASGEGPCTWPPTCRFAPSLRQLKQQAFLLHFPPTLPSRLVQRLQEVSRACRQTGLQEDFGWGDGPVLAPLLPSPPRPRPLVLVPGPAQGQGQAHGVDGRVGLGAYSRDLQPPGHLQDEGCYLPVSREQGHGYRVGSEGSGQILQHPSTVGLPGQGVGSRPSTPAPSL